MDKGIPFQTVELDFIGDARHQDLLFYYSTPTVTSMPTPLNTAVRMVDGQLSFTGGINSGVVPTLNSSGFTDGLNPNQLAWLTNGTVRGGGILQRTGWYPVVQDQGWPGKFQGAWMYQPRFADPYIIAMIGGRCYQIRVDTNNAVVDLSAAFGLTNPADEPQSYFTQGEEFLVIQAGDLVTNPLFWDGTTLRRSNGIIAPNDAGNEIPPATAMDYWMNRIWYAQGRVYSAGDIVGNTTSGTAPYNYRDSILHLTENPLAKAGDGFAVPSDAGNIRGITHTAELDTNLGQGRLYVGTRRSIYRLNVPVTRTEWIAANSDTRPLQTVAQITNGFINDRSIVRVNGDLFYQAIDGVRSLMLSTRFFQSWANTPISRNLNRVLRFNDRRLLHFASGIQFDNRLLQTVLPFETEKGVAHRGVLPLDFDLISSLENKLPPAWEGMYEGLDFLQLVEGDFGGRQRAFAFNVSRLTGEIDLWELTSFDRSDVNRFDSTTGLDGARVSWYFETPAYSWRDLFMLKKLDGMELWIDKLLGTVQITVEYRPDQYPCWFLWHAFNECTAKDCREDIDAVSCPAYPSEPYCEAYKSVLRLPAPTPQCVTSATTTGRPSDVGYQFQVRITIKGWCRIRGLLLYAQPKEQGRYQNMVC